MSNFPENIPEQIRRLGLVFLVFIAAVLVVKIVVIPPELKETGVYRVSAIERELSKPIYYVGNGSCKDCHDDQYESKENGYHRDLSCETCHGPGQEHSEEPDEVSPFIPSERSFCPLCHTYNSSRPTGFPQINPIIHNPLEACTDCHDPHDPEPPEVPRECSACHAEIARTKSVSSHVKLECIECHVTPEQHKVEPRSVKPTKPGSSAFCGKCHDRSATRRDTPKIDTNTHGQDYQCWQCHYPHLPEVK